MEEVKNETLYSIQYKILKEITKHYEVEEKLIKNIKEKDDVVNDLYSKHNHVIQELEKSIENEKKLLEKVKVLEKKHRELEERYDKLNNQYQHFKNSKLGKLAVWIWGIKRKLRPNNKGTTK